MFGLDVLTPGDQQQIRTDLRIALTGGGVAALVMAGVVLAVGNLTSFEARALLEASLPTVRFLCSSVMTASATTLALMLTMLSLSAGSEREIKRAHFERIRQIALVDVVAFVGATLLLVALVVPFAESSEIPAGWYVAIYYTSSLLASVLGGVLVAVMLLLYAAVRDLITLVGPSEDSPLYAEAAPDEAAPEDPRQQPDAG